MPNRPTRFKNVLADNVHADGNAFRTWNVQTINNNQNVTLAAWRLLGGFILRGTAGASRTDTIASAAEIVAEIEKTGIKPKVGLGFEFVIRNTAGAAENITLQGGTGVTIVGPATISQGQVGRFLAVISAMTPTVTVYTLGIS